MDIFDIDYSPLKGNKKYYLLAFLFYAGILSLIFCVQKALSSIYDLWFYCFAVLFVLTEITTLVIILYHTKPLVSITSETLLFMTDRKTVLSWDNVKNISIGVSSLKIEEVNGKIENINLESIRYDDIKKLKSKIIELCETKHLPYKNDY